MKKYIKQSTLFSDFFNSEKSGGILLILCTITSLLFTNSAFGIQYLNFWQFPIVGYSLSHWINDGLMALFFLLIGLELVREIYVGELSHFKNALLPISAALGGMIIPALFYLTLNFGSITQSGAGIPMATDIAFALGVLSLLGNKVPTSLKIFLTALAVIDDLGAILVIALCYTKTIFWMNLGIALGIFGLLLLFNLFKIKSLFPYLIGGVVMWYFMEQSGVHATITGVLVAFAIPFGTGDSKSISYKLQHHLHRPVAFIILPLFALANTAIVLNSNWQMAFNTEYTLGIALGLIVGKPLGIVLFSYSAVSLKICKLPSGVHWNAIIGTAVLGGIGFTMSIFITLLAFSNNDYINNSKIMILSASLLSGMAGFLLLNFVLKKKY